MDSSTRDTQEATGTMGLMKTRRILAWVLGLLLGAGPLAGLAAQSAVGSSPAASPGASLPADLEQAVNDLPAPTIAVPAEFPANQPGSAPDQADAQDKRLPPGSYVSGWLIELVKLAKAGVEEGVLLTFIDSAGTLNLGADQIIYLRDLGVSNGVIQAMILHDSELASGLRPMPAAAVAASEPAVQLTLAVPTEAPSQSGPSSARLNFPSVPLSREPPPSTPATLANGVAPGQPEDGARVAFAGQQLDVAVEPQGETFPPPSEQRQSPPARSGFSPVREPYAVQLSDPIIVVRAFGPTPNLQVLELSPGND